MFAGLDRTVLMSPSEYHNESHCVRFHYFIRGMYAGHLVVFIADDLEGTNRVNVKYLYEVSNIVTCSSYYLWK